MHYLNESHLLLFVLQVSLLLGLSRAFGLLLSRWGQPSITAEILVGVALGPTLLGRLMPELHGALFPADMVQQNMLETVAWLGILFFLLDTGLETDFAAAWRQRGDALIIAASDLILPMAIAFVPCLFLPASYLSSPDSRLMFSLFVAAIMTISALPVTARVLQDLKLYRSDAGLLIMSALTVNDVTGWVVFAVLLGGATGGGMDPGRIGIMLAGTLLFSGLLLTVGRRLTDRAIRGFHTAGLPEPGTSLTFICILGMLGGALTLKIGIHALFGFFLAGVMAGEAKSLSENTRHVISQMVRALLVPLFFASIGLKIDFLANFDWLLVVFMIGVGIVGRFAGAWVGYSLTSQPRANRHLVSVAHVPGGEMQIVIGMLALEYAVISEGVYVAIVFSAVFTSVILGPWMKWALKRREGFDLQSCFADDRILPDLAGTSLEDAIRELCELTSTGGSVGPTADVVKAVLAREAVMGTALGDRTAAPHARLTGLPGPVVIVGRSRNGIEWNAPDGLPVHFIFLILTPAGQDASQVRILQAIAGLMCDSPARAALDTADNAAAMATAIRHFLQGLQNT